MTGEGGVVSLAQGAIRRRQRLPAFAQRAHLRTAGDEVVAFQRREGLQFRQHGLGLLDDLRTRLLGLLTLLVQSGEDGIKRGAELAPLLLIAAGAALADGFPLLAQFARLRGDATSVVLACELAGCCDQGFALGLALLKQGLDPRLDGIEQGAQLAGERSALGMADAVERPQLLDCAALHVHEHDRVVARGIQLHARLIEELANRLLMPAAQLIALAEESSCRLKHARAADAKTLV